MDWINWAKANTDPEKAYEKPEALAGTVVLDLSYGSFAGLFASSLLAEMGARVIRIEPPAGDIARKMTPFGESVNGTGLPYLVEGRNKEHITLDLHHDDGRKIFKDLVRKADVLLETFAPGAMDDMGIGWNDLEEINPMLVYTAIHSCGQTGELADKARNAKWRCY
ncbi:MAG TPA: carnitine dehydratase, partial [Syntrophobacteraceae bacterium]|nr:carnitine dehydratase [Syntrophobacteraceae bacterium]